MKRENWVAFVPVYLLVIILSLGLVRLGNHSVTTIHQQRPVAREHVFIIDAGHGGIDGGATSCTGMLESQMNLEIALRLDDLLHFLGHDTVMIRTTDESIYTEGNTIAAQKVSDLKERVRIVNGTPGAVLISIHQNTFSDSQYKGAQVFYAPTEESQPLAKALQTNLIAAINPNSHRQVKPADKVYLLQHITAPGILLECGFLSNPQEEAQLRDADYQKKLCAVIATTCSQYFHQVGDGT